MASSLSNLVNNLNEGIYNIKCIYRHDARRVEAHTATLSAVLNTQTLKVI